jgi:hypothetical protein
MIRKTFSVPPLGCNCSIIGDPVTKQAVVVDPGGAPERILREVQALGLTVVSILHTHAHFDHFLASGAMKHATGAVLCLHQEDRPLWDMLETQCRMFGVPYVPAPPPDHWLTDEDCRGNHLNHHGHSNDDRTRKCISSDLDDSQQTPPRKTSFFQLAFFADLSFFDGSVGCNFFDKNHCHADCQHPAL